MINACQTYRGEGASTLTAQNGFFLFFFFSRGPKGRQLCCLMEIKSNAINDNVGVMERNSSASRSIPITSSQGKLNVFSITEFNEALSNN